MDEKERKARRLADHLLDGGGDAWPEKDILAFMSEEGWVWDDHTHDWTQRPERSTTT